MIISRILILLGVLATIPFHGASAESRGNLAQYPPNEVNLTITTLPDGNPKLEPMEQCSYPAIIIDSTSLAPMSVMISLGGESSSLNSYETPTYVW